MPLPLLDGTPHVWLASCWLDGEHVVVAGASEADANAQLSEFLASEEVEDQEEGMLPAEQRATGYECYAVPVRGY